MLLKTFKSPCQWFLVARGRAFHFIDMRSHKIDQDKFYKNLKFYFLEDLRYKGKFRNRRYNNMPKLVLGFKSPNEVEH